MLIFLTYIIKLIFINYIFILYNILQQYIPKNKKQALRIYRVTLMIDF